MNNRSGSMKKLYKYLLIIILAIISMPMVVKAKNDSFVTLDYKYQKIVKLGENTTYSFLPDIPNDYEFFIYYNPEYLELVQTNIHVDTYHGIGGGSFFKIDDDKAGKITVKRIDQFCDSFTLTFKTLKEGVTKIDVKAGDNLFFAEGGGPQAIDIQTEIINMNKEDSNCQKCEKCQECEKCEECQECEETTKNSSNEEKSNTILYVIIAILMVITILSTIVAITNVDKKRKKVK